MNGKSIDNTNNVTSTRIQTSDPKLRPNKNVLLSPGRIVSASYLLAKNRFRNIHVRGLTGAALAKEVFQSIANDGIPTLEKFRVKANKGEVPFKTTII